MYYFNKNLKLNLIYLRLNAFFKIIKLVDDVINFTMLYKIKRRIVNQINQHSRNSSIQSCKSNLLLKIK